MSGLRRHLRGWAGVFLLLTSLIALGQFEDPESALRRADTALGQGRFDVAQQIYERTLRSNPNLNLSADRCKNIGEANIRATHPNIAVGEDWLQRAVDKAPANDITRERLAEVLLRNFDSSRAAAQYRTLIAHDPANQRYMLGLAIAQRNLGQLDEAAEFLSTALQQHPDYTLLRIEYGRNLAYQQNFREAAKQYQQVLDADANNIAARLGMAKVFSWQGDQTKALVEYDKVLQKDPQNYDALVGEAFSLIWNGRQGDALPLLERANSRHPEDTEVRDALKRLGGVTIFTGETRVTEPPLPILPPATRKAPGNRSTTTAAANASTPADTKGLHPESNPPKPATDQSSPSESVQQRSSAEGHTVLWLVGMAVMMMVLVFAIAGFLLFLWPAMRDKKKQAESKPVSPPAPKTLEPWARLEEFARGATDEFPKSAKPTVPTAPKKVALPVFEDSVPAYRPKPKPMPEPPPKVEAPEPEPAVPSPEISIPLEPLSTEVAAAPSNGSDSSARLPRRRRGAPSERPWWRELPTPAMPESPSNGDSVLKPIPAPAPELAARASVAPEPLPAPTPVAPLIDAHESDVVIAKANPLIPASERPRPVEEEPPSARPFTLVLSRALERAGDGHVEEAPLDEPSTHLVAEEEDSEWAPKAAPAPEPEAEVAELDEETRKSLQGMTAVIVGCGVMVSHYRMLLRSAGVDVRTFTFWDLAMTSMRKRRADILLIDGDALDGFTPTQMYTSAHVERYMFSSVLVGVSSDDDRSAIPDNVVLPHSLSDTDLQTRLVASIKQF